MPVNNETLPVNNIWKSINGIEPDLMPPDKVLHKLSAGLNEATNQLIDYKIEKVNFFPEEVEYSIGEFESDWGGSRNPHPEFGYDTNESTELKFRYRYLLLVKNNPSIKAEIFKFRYPLNFYPVTFFIPKGRFGDLEMYFKGKQILANCESNFNDICTSIFQSDDFSNIIKRLSALGAGNE